jgi:hypothetical protein
VSDGEDDPPLHPAPRRSPRIRPYFEAWLAPALVASTFAVYAFIDQAKRGAGDGSLGGSLVFCFVAALLALPALWILRLFPEPSPSTAVRLFRRALIGFFCAGAPAALLAGILVARAADQAPLGEAILGLGMVFGLVAGIVDSIHIDSARGGGRG